MGAGRYVLAFDQGTTSSRALLFDRGGRCVAVAQKEFTQHFPQPGWVEHDPEEIWASQLAVAREALSKVQATADDIAAIGITNQRETTVVWNRATGKAVCPAIVWQDRRTALLCDQLKSAGHADLFQARTGLVIDPYFSGAKIRWILDSVPGARAQAEAGELAFGTIDSWLIWKLTSGACHLTDASNASRTLLFNIRAGAWDNELLAVLDLPPSMLPKVVASSAVVCETSPELFGAPIPVAGIAGDQQAALFGQRCIRPGMVKNTYGTGCFLLMHTGEEAPVSRNQLVTTVAWKLGERLEYALEGSIFIAGAVVQWLRDGLGLIRTSADVEELAASVPDNGGVYLVPAFSGLGAPYWDPYARGLIAGITRGTSAAHFARAALEGIAYQVADVVSAMEGDSGLPVPELRVDGGAAANRLLMQFQSDILGVPIIRPQCLETTALGAAYLAGLAVGYWSSQDEISALWTAESRFTPAMPQDERDRLRENWRKAVERTRG